MQQTIYNELYIEVLDIRNPNKNRKKLHNMPLSHKYKTLILLNKCDLVPKWIIKFWMKYYASYFPVLAVSNNQCNSYGIKSILFLIKNFFSKIKQNKIKKIYISGYKKTGKTTIINSLKQKKKHTLRQKNNLKNISKYIYVIEITPEIDKHNIDKNILKIINSVLFLIRNNYFTKFKINSPYLHNISKIKSIFLLKKCIPSKVDPDKIPYYVMPFKY